MLRIIEFLMFQQGKAYLFFIGLFDDRTFSKIIFSSMLSAILMSLFCVLVNGILMLRGGLREMLRFSIFIILLLYFPIECNIEFFEQIFLFMGRHLVTF